MQENLILDETIAVLSMKISFALNDMIFPCTGFQKDYFGSTYLARVFKTIQTEKNPSG